MWLSGRKERPLALANVDHRRGAADRPHDVGVDRSSPLRSSGRCRSCRRAWRAGRARPRPPACRTDPGSTSRPRAAPSADLLEAHDERIVEPLVIVEDDDPLEVRAAGHRTSRILLGQLVVLDEAQRAERGRGCRRPVRQSSSDRAARSRCRWRARRSRRDATRAGCWRRCRPAGRARCRARPGRR